MNEAPDEIIVASLEVLVMPNGEIICQGETLGWVKTSAIAKSLTPVRSGITGKPIEKEEK